jgi:hypothetical protein
MPPMSERCSWVLGRGSTRPGHVLPPPSWARTLDGHRRAEAVCKPGDSLATQFVAAAKNLVTAYLPGSQRRSTDKEFLVIDGIRVATPRSATPRHRCGTERMTKRVRRHEASCDKPGSTTSAYSDRLKQCRGKCGRELPTTEFSPGQGKCKKCRWDHRKRSECSETKPCRDCGAAIPGRIRYCEQCRQRRYEEAQARSLAKKMAVVEWMRSIIRSTPCTDCGEIKDKMDWDHLPGTQKLAKVSDFVWNGDKQGALLEMAKCELVCTMCHGRRGMQRSQLHSIR